VVLEEPHKVHYYYGTLLLEYNRSRSSELFAEDDYPGLYFASHHIASLARAASLKAPAFRNWAYHTALLIKHQVAPELRKKAKLTDKKFLEVLKRIDEGYANAFRVACTAIRALKLHDNQNRFPDATKAIVEQFFRSQGTTKSDVTSVRQPSTEVVESTLVDGIYVCIVESLQPEKLRASVRYGPFRLDAHVDTKSLPKLRIGIRVPFKIVGGSATVYVPTAPAR
jgi:hypothetical protein